MTTPPQVGAVVTAAFMGILCVVGMLTNAVSILFYVRRPVMRTSTNVYLVHKAAVDLLSLLPFPLHLLELLNADGGWTFGNWPCKFVASLETLCMLVSASLIFGMAYDRVTAITRPGQRLERTVSTARNHVVAAWVYSLILFLPVVAAGWSVEWPPRDPALSRPTCGYQWPADEKYHSMYFGSILVIVYAGHYLIFACFIYIIWRRVRQSKEEFLARHDTLQRCRAALSVITVNFIAYFVFWAQHVYTMILLGDDQTHVPHIPSGLPDPFSLSSSVAVYVAAGSNLFLYSLSMDQWRNVAADALRCRCAAGRGVHPLNAEDAVAVIDVSAAADGNNSANNDNDNGSMTNLSNHHHSDEEFDIQEIAL